MKKTLSVYLCVKVKATSDPTLPSREGTEVWKPILSYEYDPVEQPTQIDASIIAHLIAEYASAQVSLYIANLGDSENNYYTFGEGTLPSGSTTKHIRDYAERLYHDATRG